MITRYTILSLFLLGGTFAQAQDYCAPVFNNGCFNWRSMNISLGGTDWVPAGACTEFDHTATVMTVGAGEATPMAVENGVWCGVSVYVDLNNNYTFDPEELLFNEYNGNQPSRVHEFQITVPLSTPSGMYRLRVLNHWGSDGVNSTNGSGPCGPYEYGNYDEFTLQVVGAAGITDKSIAPVVLSPNPTSGIFRIEAEVPYEQLTIMSIDGRSILDQGANSNATTTVLDLSAEAAGLYTVRYETALGMQVMRLVKE
ncbi:MAG: GEVED domain-containing protein [Flavobacteriales bacterium]